MRSVTFISERESLCYGSGRDVTFATEHSTADMLSVHTLAYLTATFHELKVPEGQVCSEKHGLDV